MPLSVTEQRWRHAQQWELAFWLRGQRRSFWKRGAYAILEPLLLAVGSPRATGDDRNLWWRDQFQAYDFLPEDVGDYIELGCGPYTNTRLILQGRSARRVVCSDPLANEYVNFRNRWLARAYRQRSIELDAHPIEECPFAARSFDTVVLINVLDHVRDARVCLDVATGLVREGGHFIFGQDLSDPSSIGHPNYKWFEEGHPIRLCLSDVAPWLDRFETIVQEVLPPRDPRLQTGVLVFAGRKLDHTTAS